MSKSRCKYACSLAGIAKTNKNVFGSDTAAPGIVDIRSITKKKLKDEKKNKGYVKKSRPRYLNNTGGGQEIFHFNIDFKKIRFELSLGNIGLCQPEQILIIGRY